MERPSQEMMQEISEVVLAMCAGERDEIALMATISCELFQRVEGYDWVGFYRVVAPGLLKIGPYQGGHGCLTIPFERGVCGAAARTEQTQLVANVHHFPGHIACSSTTNSELVLPIFDAAEQLIAVLDLDSDQLDFFTVAQAEWLQQLMSQIFQQS